MPSTLIAQARAAAIALERAGIDPAEARLDAELLARHVLGWDRVQWLLRAHEAPPVPDATLAPLIARRVAREPIAYVLGAREFWGLSFEVTSDVLVPRPETEIIVEQALDRLPCDTRPLVADVGTGSGCLAVSLAVERPRARVVATDLSGQALHVARRNSRRHGVAARLVCCQTSLLDCLAAASCDLVVSNPPYVPLGCRELLPPEVRDHEPALALYAGTEGLDVIRALVRDAARVLRPGGWLLFEFGLGQAAAVEAELADPDTWTTRTLVPDLQGIPRVAVAQTLTPAATTAGVPPAGAGARD
jgi:release factor glutamine methyltransferase